MLSSFNEALQNDKWFDRTSSVEYKTITFTEKSKLMLFLLLAQAIRSTEKKNHTTQGINPVVLNQKWLAPPPGHL